MIFDTEKNELAYIKIKKITSQFYGFALTEINANCFRRFEDVSNKNVLTVFGPPV